jgi:hypothetical protein
MLALAAIAVSLIAIASVVITARRALRKPR